MSDLVNNLLARATGAAQTIRPRIATAFEPASIATPPALAPDIENVRIAETPGVMEPVAPIQRKDAVGAPAATVVNNISTPPSPVAPPRSEKRRAEMAPNLNPVPAAEPVIQQLVMERKAAAAPQRSEIGMRSEVVNAPASQETSHAIRSKPAEPERTVETIVRTETIAATPVKPPQPRSIMPAAVRLAAPQLQPTTAPATTESDSVVHVSIGRIEIRAITPERATKQTRKQPPVMSLEDYLKSRKAAAK